MRPLRLLHSLLGLLGALILSAPVFAASCEGLASLKLPNTTITLAQTVGAGSFTMPPPPPLFATSMSPKDLPAFCRVTATLRPSQDSEIKIEVWMPTNGWNGKFQAAGNGGWAGDFIYAVPDAFQTAPALMGALKEGFATAQTDTGHSGAQLDGSFAFGHPEKVIDFGYRSVHEMTLKAKAIIAAFYGKPPSFSYWNGCSTGGRQGLAEAQLYPADYDAIVDGAPANYMTHLQAWGLWVNAAVHKDDASYIPPQKYPAIHKAVVDECDALDGLKDGLITDPRICHFDPKVLACKGEDQPTCLTPAQVEAARKIYSPVKNPRTGQELFPRMEPGSELNWGFIAGPKPIPFATDLYGYLVFNDRNWDFHTFDFDKDVELADKKDNHTVNDIDPNLDKFFGRGGKLLMYHGWEDALIPPGNSINYYTSVVDRIRSSKATNSIRLFMVPGMDHCGSGDGPNIFERISAIQQWREHGKAPNQIIASQITKGTVTRTRPLCPYPQVAKYKGTGSIDDAANFVCQAP